MCGNTFLDNPINSEPFGKKIRVSRLHLDARYISESSLNASVQEIPTKALPLNDLVTYQILRPKAWGIQAPAMAVRSLQPVGYSGYSKLPMR